jgi:enolase
MALYRDAVKQFPFVIMEDPLDEDDFEGHAITHP